MLFDINRFNGKAIKLTSTAINFIFSIVLGLIVPRYFGAETYGVYAYLIATFTFIFQLFLFNSNTGYIYFLSENVFSNKELNKLYAALFLTLSIVIITLTLFSINTDLGIKYLWNGFNDSNIILLAMLMIFLTTTQERLVEYSDCTEKTVQTEFLKISSKVLLIIGVFVLIEIDQLSIESFILLSILSLFTFVSIFFYVIKFEISFDFSYEAALIKDFLNYIKPLIFFSIVAALYTYLGKYVLQSSGGNIEQGYFLFAYQLSIIPVMFIASLSTLYTKEIIKKIEINRIDSVGDIFVLASTRIYTIHAFLSFFLLFNAKDIILLTVGESFVDSAETLKFLCVFSLLHSFGMLSSSVFYASKRTKQYNLINSTIMAIGIGFYLFIYSYGSLNAVLLASFMTFTYFIRVLIQLLYNLSYMNLDKIVFFKKFIYPTFLTVFVVMLANQLSPNIVYNILIAVLGFLTINYLVRDQIGIREFLGGLNGKR